MDFDKLLQKRRSIRRYSNKKISFDDVAEICNSARFAPCAANIFTTRIIIIQNKEKIEKIADACLNQEFIKDAPYVLVVCSQDSLLKKSYREFAERYARQQTGASIQNMLLKTTELGLATCWIGAFEENEIRSLLKIPEECRIDAILPIAKPFPKMKIQEKRKPELKNIVFFEKWGESTKEKQPMPAL